MRIKLVAVLLLVTIMQVSASALAQNVTLHHHKITLAQVFKEIGKQTGYNVLWEPDKLNSSITIDARFSNASVKEVMEKCLQGTLMNYVIEDKTIVVAEKERSVLDRLLNIFKNIDLKAKVTDEKGNALVGATVKLKNFNRSTTTNQYGSFEFKNVDENAIIVISYMGYTSKTFVAKELSDKSIVLQINTGDLSEVSVVSDGYQKISKERATASYEFLDSAIINRGVSANIIDRIENMAPGILTLRNKSASNANEPSFSIRGRSTLFSAVEPLVVVDNYPFEGDINSINPNDVESITILKDAAATSVWGARGGNGVLVITMKKGKLNQPAEVSFNSSWNIAGKADLYSVPQLSSSEFIDVQQFLYDKGLYGFTAPKPGDIVSPLVRILNEKRNKLITADEAEARIAQLRNQDVRDDLTKYTQDNILNQQYALSIRGGGAQNKYFLSAGYNKEHGSDRSDRDRKSFSLNESYSFFKDKLQVNAKVMFSDTRHERSNYNLPVEAVFPYTRLVDEQANPVEIPYKYTKTQIAGLAGGKLLDMTHIPLDEYNYGRTKGHIQDYSINADAAFKFSNQLQLSLSYQYGSGFSNVNDVYDVESFQTREIINRFTTYNTATGVATLNVPYGGSEQINRSTYNNHNTRSLLTYNNSFGPDHQVSALAGIEIRSTNMQSSIRQEYGYNKEFDTYQRYNAAANIVTVFNGQSSSIPNVFRNTNISNRFISIFANASYTYKNRYIASASIRKDESNLFGVDANKKGVPLWSAGAAWIINKEPFYNLAWLPLLKLRLTNGFSGNTNPNTSSKTIASLGTGTNLGLGEFYKIDNPPNAELRWEKVQQINLGIDFGLKGNIISGSFEYFRKKGIDLISQQPVAPQVGVINFTGNFADINTTGFDLALSSRQITTKKFSWNSHLIVSRAVDVITKFDVVQDPRNSVGNNANIPRVGYAYSALFTYKYAGLNSLGQSMVYSNGIPTTDLLSVVSAANENDIVYIGNNNPKVSGSLRNDFSYKNLSLSFLISYRLGHYLKRQSINYNSLFQSNYKQADFSKRWQKPGDELFTNVPVMAYPAYTTESINSQNAYSLSDALVEQGDNIRLQDIQLTYNFTRSNFKKLPFRNLQLYGYASNLGLLWKATEYDLDPDYPGSARMPKQFSLGLRATL